MSNNIDRRDLSLYEVEVLLRSTAKDNIKTHSFRSWLSIADTKQLLAAIAHDADSTWLTNAGREFNIKYKDNRVWLSPSDGRSFTPCGWFTPLVLEREVDENSVISTL